MGILALTAAAAHAAADPSEVDRSDVLEEEPAHAARLAAVFEKEVLVAGLLEAGVVGGVVPVAGGAGAR